MGMLAAGADDGAAAYTAGPLAPPRDTVYVVVVGPELLEPLTPLIFHEKLLLNVSVSVPVLPLPVTCVCEEL
jgi:hypothetical protein